MPSAISGASGPSTRPSQRRQCGHENARELDRLRRRPPLLRPFAGTWPPVPGSRVIAIAVSSQRSPATAAATTRASSRSPDRPAGPRRRRPGCRGRVPGAPTPPARPPRTGIDRHPFALTSSSAMTRHLRCPTARRAPTDRMNHRPDKQSLRNPRGGPLVPRAAPLRRLADANAARRPLRRGVGGACANVQAMGSNSLSLHVRSNHGCSGP
jgi:hypothetical protein